MFKSSLKARVSAGGERVGGRSAGAPARPWALLAQTDFQGQFGACCILPDPSGSPWWNKELKTIQLREALRALSPLSPTIIT